MELTLKSLNFYLPSQSVDGNHRYRKTFDQSEARNVLAEIVLNNPGKDNGKAKFELTVLEKNPTGVAPLSAFAKDVDLAAEETVRADLGLVAANAGKPAVFKKGGYPVRLVLNGTPLTNTELNIMDMGPVMEHFNPYLEVSEIKLFEANNGESNNPKGKYYIVFSKDETRYLWVCLTVRNKTTATLASEVTIRFFDSAGNPQGQIDQPINIPPGSHNIRRGWGATKPGTWPHNAYTCEIEFMGEIIAKYPFEVSSYFQEGKNTLAKGENGGALPKAKPAKPHAHPHPDDGKTLEELLTELESLVGLQKVKKDIHNYIKYLKFLKIRKEKGFDEDFSLNLHTVFKGNPGTGKTTVAKLLGRIYHKMGMLSKGQIHEVGRAELVAEFTGQTAPKTKKAIEKARGGVLFIDEAYSLVRDRNDSKDFGREVIEVLIKEMSDGPGDLAVIMAGYTEEMTTLLSANPGLLSRIGKIYMFDDFQPVELLEIAQYSAKKKGVLFTEDAKDYLFTRVTEAYRARDRTFGNARLMVGTVEAAKMNMGMRIMDSDDFHELDSDTLSTIILDDVQTAFPRKEQAPHVQIDIEEALVDEGLNELNELVGMNDIKNEIHELIKLVRYYRAIGKELTGVFSAHTIFKGNPGTGKTTVARILAKIYKGLGVLERGHLVEVDRQGLVAGYIGQTAIKTKEMVDRAMGGMLFIDEAYSLTSQSGNDFGKEAVEIILKSMEDHRGQLCVVAAGYPDNMDEFIKMNPGLVSRFDKTMLFEDYTPEEMMDIALLIFRKQSLEPDESALLHLRRYFLHLYNSRDKYFGNARTVRKTVEKAVRNQNLRMAAMSSHDWTEDAVKCVTLSDVEEFSPEREGLRQQPRIGFVPGEKHA